MSSTVSPVLQSGLFDAPTVHREYHGEKELDEKDVEQPKSSDVDDYPDGGARAWLIVLGVRVLFSLRNSFSDPFR